MPPVGWERAGAEDRPTKPISSGIGRGPPKKLGMLFPEERGMNARQAKTQTHLTVLHHDGANDVIHAK